MRKIYKIILSTKDTIQVYEDEVDPIVLAIHRGDKIVMTRRGIFNPSYYVTIVLDQAEMEYQQERLAMGADYALPEHFDLEGIKRLAEMKNKLKLTNATY